MKMKFDNRKIYIYGFIIQKTMSLALIEMILKSLSRLKYLDESLN
jgi:hypothetical protein